MNYSRNISIRNKRRLRNIIISWLIVLVIDFMIGFGIGKVGQADSVEALAQFSEVEPYLFEKYEDPEKVLMAYNMGETGAKRLWDKGIYETDYTNKVIKNIMKIKNYINERMENNE